MSVQANMIDDDVLRLREYIEGHVVSSGDLRLPPEPKLSEALGVSRGRLRTVLKRLEDEGLIWRHVGKGTFVGPRHVKPDDGNWSSSVSVDNIMDARLVLEPQLAAQAAVHATPADIASMDQCLADMASTGPFTPWKRLDEHLHRIVAESTHNALLLMLYDTMRVQVRLNLDTRMEEVFTSQTGPRHDTDGEHRLLVDAIRTHNPAKAEQLMREHLRSVRIRLFGLR
ncbi:FadR family transcriptional regulator [Paraburkholderia dipogonis]|uniref:FadR family transcriptional regulator n=2 Tax=Paraburkholderia dipogonis TaxID=1211383 RepID=A0A4Y8ML16_9BURK|nr:FadR family transcriptional regulator [Paraburkholderia dipogonis]